jgi:hypothetical protein
MNKLAVLTGVLFAATGKTTITYGSNPFDDYACFTYDETTGENVEGTTGVTFAEGDSTTTTAGTKYAESIDLTFTADGNMCYQFTKQDFALEWTITTGDELSEEVMFAVEAIGWIQTDDACDLDIMATDITVVNGEDYLTDDTTACAYLFSASYDNGETSASVAIDATTQVVTFYTNNAVITAAGIASVAVASMFF